MTPALPPELDRLLRARPHEREHAWESFLAEYSRLLLHTARSVCSDRDEMMDAYTFILDELRTDDGARLRGFTPDGRSKFTTWLVVVVRRLCFDFLRKRHGRSRPDASIVAVEEQQFRKRLAAFIGEDVELGSLASSAAPADEQIQQLEIHDALSVALAALPSADRLLLKLRFEDDLSAPQIARLLQLTSQFHVYRRIDSITRTLRRALQLRGVESATP